MISSAVRFGDLFIISEMGNNKNTVKTALYKLLQVPKQDGFSYEGKPLYVAFTKKRVAILTTKDLKDKVIELKDKLASLALNKGTFKWDKKIFPLVNDDSQVFSFAGDQGVYHIKKGSRKLGGQNRYKKRKLKSKLS